MSPERAKELIKAFGEDYVLFGTDYPMWEIGEELNRFDQLKLPEQTQEKILYQNLMGLLKRYPNVHAISNKE